MAGSPSERSLPDQTHPPVIRITPYQRRAYKLITAAGRRYSVRMRVGASQEALLSQIIDFGFELAVPEETMTIVAVTALKESAFGVRKASPESNAFGVFKFTDPTWSDHYRYLDRESASDQIAAMYDRVDYFRDRYAQLLAEGSVCGSMTFPEYAYVIHKQGQSRPQTFEANDETQDALILFRDKWLILSLRVE